MENEDELERSDEGLYEHYRFKADLGQEIIRVDKYLLDRLPNTSRNKIQTAARNGTVQVNGHSVKQNYRVKPGDEVALVLPYPMRQLELIPQDIPLNIVYEDTQVIIVNKPADMVVHPGYGNYSGTLVNALVHHFGNLPELNDDYYGRPGLVHRIDKHTTGLLVIAKTEIALNQLAKQFYEKTTERKYQTLVWGDVTESGTVTANLGRSPKNRKVMTVFPNEENGKHAVTHFKVLERFGYVTLLECQLETGRTHQIRVHMKHIGHPVFNDLEYGGNKLIFGQPTQRYQQFINNCLALLPGQALHAATLGFIHPEKKSKVFFTCPPPQAFQLLIEKWRQFVQVKSINNELF
jgi:23S rRNA pseudouridine1911/1915/1917 synthase